MQHIWVCLLGLILVWGLGLPVSAQLLPLPVESSLPPIKLLPNQAETPEVAAEQAPKTSRYQWLFQRQPWIFDAHTFEALGQRILHWPRSIQGRWATIRANPMKYALFWGVILFFLGLAIWFDRKTKRLPAVFLKAYTLELTAGLKHFIIALVSLFGRLLVPAIMLFGWYTLDGAYPQSLVIKILIQLTWILLAYRILKHPLNQLMVIHLKRIYPEPDWSLVTQFYRRCRNLLLMISLFMACYKVAELYEYQGDMLQLLAVGFQGLLLVYFSLLLLRKHMLLAAIPPIEQSFYQQFRHFLAQQYRMVMGFTLLLGALWTIGYQALSQTLFLFTWVLLGLFLATLLIHRGIHYLLQEYLETPDSPTFAQELARAALLIEIILFLRISFHILGLNRLIDTLAQYPLAVIAERTITIVSFINGALVLTLFWMVARILNAFLEERLYPKTQFDAGLRQILSMSAFYLLMILGGMIALNVVGLDLSVLAIFAGALAFGIGFGLQGIAKNFASGLILIFTGLVKKGDYITLGEHTGYIQQVSWKSVHLKTPDNVDLIIPTVNLVESTITNWNYSGKIVRLHVPVGVSYGEDVEIVKQALLEAAGEHEEVLKHPPPTVWLVGFGDSSVDFELLVWINTEHITQVRLAGELNFNIWHALKRYDIEIPFPQRDIHIKSGLPDLTPPSEST